MKERKPFKVGDSIAIALPPEWTEIKHKRLKIIADKVGLIIPPDVKKKEVKRYVDELLKELG
ncbi:MAG: hypothetical protein QXW83_00590 [Nitrososphaerales archaeon]